MLPDNTTKPAPGFNPLAILESAPFGVICVDNEWRICYCNFEAASMLGCSYDRLPGMRLFEACAIFQEPVLFTAMEQAITSHVPVVERVWLPNTVRRIEMSASYAKGLLTLYFKDAHNENETTCKPASQESNNTELAQSAEAYHLLFEKAPLAKWLYHSGTLKIIDVNAAAIRQYGYSRNEFLSMSVPDICTPHDRRILAGRVASGQELTGEWAHITKEGKIFLVDIATTCLEYRHTNVCLATINNITERQTLETELKDSQEKLSRILENLGDGFLTVDKNWTIGFLNRKAEIFLGREKSFFLGKYLWDVFHDAVHTRFFVEYNRAMNENLPVHFEEYYPGLDAWFGISAFPSADGLSIFFQNINEKMRQREEEYENGEKLRRAETSLMRVLESMSDGFYTLDPDWNITYATDKICFMLGISKNDYVGHNLWTCLPEAKHTAFFREFHRARNEDKAVTFEEYLSTFNMWFEVNAYPHDGILSVYVKNITQRKNDEKRLEFIARATSEVIWEHDLSSEKAYVNSEKFCCCFGHHLPGNQISLAFWRSIVHPEDLKAIEQPTVAATEKDADHCVYEYRLKKDDGSWAWVKDRVYVIKDEQGRPVRRIGAVQDITAEHEAREALKKSEETYRQLFDFASLPKAIYDRETLRILHVNKAAIEHYGYSRKELLGMTILDIRPHEDRTRLREVVKKTSLNSRSCLGVWTHIKKNGEKILCEVSVSTIVFENRVCNMAAVMDVTEKLKLQQQLTKEKIERQKSITRIALEAQEKERSVIGRDLHDGVNQMLTAAKLYVENIKFYPAQSDEFLNKSVALLQKSINEIRVLSKALVTPATTDIGFEQALLEMIEGYKDLRLFEIHHEICRGSAAIGQDVKLTVYRIMQEQLNNIVKYAKASQVNIQVNTAAGKLLVMVEDNGAGFDMLQKRSGIGLKNIQHRAELFKGKVKLQSAPAKGCKLEVSFPLDPKQIQDPII